MRRSDFERYAGSRVKIEMAVAVEGRRRFRGLLLGVEGDAARIRRDDAAAGEAAEVLLPIDEMAEAKIVLSDDADRESLRRGKARRARARQQRRRPRPSGRAGQIPAFRGLSSRSRPTAGARPINEGE